MNMTWTDEAKKRLERVPAGFMRDMTQSRIEKFAKGEGVDIITIEIAEGVIGEARKAMDGMMGEPARQASPKSLFYRCQLCGYTAEVAAPDRCPVCGAGKERFELIDSSDKVVKQDKELKWSSEAVERLKRIPEGFIRDMTRWRIEKMAREKGLSVVTADVMQEKYDYWSHGSAKIQKMFPWAKDAEEKVERIPFSVRGMVIKEVEALAEKKGLKEITLEIIEDAKEAWKSNMEFHSDVEIKEKTIGLDDGFLKGLKEEVFSHEGVNHPFLERFSQGGFTREEVRTFALHYYQHAKMFSHYIANIIPKIPNEIDRMPMVKNLMDEYGNLNPEKTHPALFRKFLLALGIKRDEMENFKPIPEVTSFIDRMTLLTRYEPFLIGLGAAGPGVEWVIPTMFNKIVKGLRKSISIGEDDLEYWTSHIILDVEHGEEATKVLMNYMDGEGNLDMVRAGAMKALDARKVLWDGFERLMEL